MLLLHYILAIMNVSIFPRIGNYLHFFSLIFWRRYLFVVNAQFTSLPLLWCSIKGDSLLVLLLIFLLMACVPTDIKSHLRGK